MSADPRAALRAALILSEAAADSESPAAAAATLVVALCEQSEANAEAETVALDPHALARVLGDLLRDLEYAKGRLSRLRRAAAAVLEAQP